MTQNLDRPPVWDHPWGLEDGQQDPTLTDLPRGRGIGPAPWDTLRILSEIGRG